MTTNHTLKTYELLGLRNAVRSAVIMMLVTWGNKEIMSVHYRERLDF